MTVESTGPIPDSVPLPLFTPHEFQRFDIASTTVPEHGDLRRRARFRTVAQRSQVQWLLTQSQFNTFWNWYDIELDAGMYAFGVPVSEQGRADKRRNFRFVWYTAQFVSPWQATVLNAGRARGLMYRVSATLVLYGTGSLIRPDFSLRASTRTIHDGSVEFELFDVVAYGDNEVDGGYYVTGSLIRLPTPNRLYVAGWGPFLKSPRTASPGVTAFTLEGLAPDFVGFAVRTGISSVTLAGLVPAAISPFTVVPAVSAVSIAGRRPILIRSAVMLPSTGAVSVTGLVPTVVT